MKKIIKINFNFWCSNKLVACPLLKTILDAKLANFWIKSIYGNRGTQVSSSCNCVHFRLKSSINSYALKFIEL